MALPRFPTRVEAPVPEGWTEAELRELMYSFSIDDTPPGEFVGYVDEAFWRFLHTWDLVRGERGRVLELGSNPYFMSYMLKEFTELDVVLGNYFGPKYGVGPFAQQVSWADRDGTERSAEYASEMFNIEEDRFPFPDNSFDVVLFCEIIEHLLDDPMRALHEIHRILRPGGLIVVTTPNVARLSNVLALVAGANIYDPYSAFGPYGRHNREYTQHELIMTMKFCGFVPVRHFTADSCQSDLRDQLGYKTIAPALEFRKNDLGQYLFAAARAEQPPRAGRIDFLFRSYPEDELVSPL